MEYELSFSARHTYDSRSEGINVPAVLESAGKRIELLDKIDTGASDCLFEHAYGVALGLRIEEGVRLIYSTVNSRFEAYGHQVSIQVLGTETTATVYFFADPSIERNVLGRRGWLDRLRFGLVEYDQAVYLANYNE